MTRNRAFRFALPATLALSLACAAERRPPEEAHEKPQSADETAPNVEVDLPRRLASCRSDSPQKTRFSIAHRGASAHHPEHTRQSYEAAARMGAGLVECDVSFTKDGVGVCRHSACDLHLSTNILDTPLASRCRRAVASTKNGSSTPPAHQTCCVTDLTMTEFKSLCGKSPDPSRKAPAPSACGTLLTHDESITLLDSLGVDFIPELKGPPVSSTLPELEIRRRSLEFLEAYERAGIAPERVFPQSFDLDTISLWSRENPTYAKQAIFLDARPQSDEMNPDDPATFVPSMTEIKSRGAASIAPPFWALLVERDARVRETAYAKEARRAGLGIVAWTLHRPSLLQSNRAKLKPPFSRLLETDESYDSIIDQLARHADVWGLFSDDPAKVTRYANCYGL